MAIIIGSETRNSSLVVNRDELLCGNSGGRKAVLSAGHSGVNPVVRVQKTAFGRDVDPTQDPTLKDFVESAVIENLIIDGKGMGVTGILLENVVHCHVRNVTIMNCDVGIHIRDHMGLWSECNTLKHIRMENVKKGIVFTTTGPYEYHKEPEQEGDDGTLRQPGNSAAFTTIEDVDIALADGVGGCVGIQIGGMQIVNSSNPPNDIDTMVKLGNDMCPVFIDVYSSHLRAVVRLGSMGGCGLRVVNGFLHFAQAHLTVIGHNESSDVGIDLQEAHVRRKTCGYPPNGLADTFIFYSQFSKIDNNNNLTSPGGFMLVTSDILPQKRLLRHSNDDTKIDIEVKSLT